MLPTEQFTGIIVFTTSADRCVGACETLRQQSVAVMKFTFSPESRPLDGYTIKRAVHRGGFGEVYYALSDAGKEVALKLLNNNLAVELRGVRQCLNLKHPNLVTIFDVRQDADKDHWVIMEYVGGRGLYDTLRDYPHGMPIDEVLPWLSGLTAGLAFLHDRGIVHRDLKPANIFRDHGGVKIGDIGLSKYISESRRSAQTQSVGTVYYMAPEVARGRYGREVDVYALGVILYEMLTGNVPFDGQTTAEILMKHLTAEPDLSVLPASLRQLIGAMLEKDPEKRISDVEEVERRFRTAVAASPQHAPVTAQPTTADRRRQPAFAAVGSSTRHPGTADPLYSETYDADTVHSETVIDGPNGGADPAEMKSPLQVAASWWNALPAPLQWITGGAAALLILESGLLRPVAVGGMIGGAAYLAYQIFSTILGTVSRDEIGTPRARRHEQRPPKARQPDVPRSDPPRTPETTRQAAATSASRRESVSAAAPSRKRQQRRLTPAAIRRISFRQRTSDMTTSASVSLPATVLVTTAVFLTTDLLKTPIHAVYFGTVALLAAWTLIVPSKFWEGRPGDGFTRRLCLGSLGLGVGFIAAVLAQYLLISQDSLFVGGKPSQPVLVGRVAMSDGSGF
ncbi:MAG: protein kinase, partial [Planctomycetaceae bacterium]|nr:protein kinase [Planctomycetaceae bacterium]